MEDNKAWYQSSGVWGGIVTLGAAIAGGFGIVVDEGSQKELVGYLVALGTAVGGVLALYGRVTANKKIG